VAIRCNRHPCPGKILDTGFCDECGHRPRPEVRPPDAGASRSARRSLSRSTGDGVDSELYSLPVFEFPDPSSRILSTPNVPGKSRQCVICGGGLGGSEGYCTVDGHPYSFLPSLDGGDLVAGQYKVVGCFAHGGFGWVYLAKDTNLDDSSVVLKGQIDASDSDLTPIERRTLRMADHPNIVRIFNFVNHPGKHTTHPRDYIVMEYVDGLVLSEVIEEAAKGRTPLGEPLRVEHVIVCGLQILAAFDYLHGRQRLYCDMKPQNVIIRSGQSGERANRVKLIDLGAVRQIGDRTSKIIGTRPYQVSDAEIDERGLTVQSDIHTLGVTLDELFRVTVDHAEYVAGRSPAMVGLDSFRRVLARAMDRAADRRFASAAAMADQLRAVYREIASARDERPRPDVSVAFAPTARLMDAGLGAVRALRAWVDDTRTNRAALPLADGRPAPAAVAVCLPVPRVDPEDAAAEFLNEVEALAPRALLGKLSTNQHGSAEVHLARCRVELELGDCDAAARSAEQAGPLLSAVAGGYWRMNWHSGLLALASGRIEAAAREFDEVYQALPGEDAPKLALAYCAEVLGDTGRAEELYRAVWRRDRLQVSAAFGLARICLSKGDRPGAVRELDGVPKISQHAEAAALARVVVRSKVLDCGSPTVDDLRCAVELLGEVKFDGEEARERLVAAVRESAFGWVEDNRGRLPIDGGAVVGDHPDGNALRRALERSYLALAKQARDADSHAILVDLANRTRPTTFL
jgi:serine/threonine-protein kinase PknG